MPPRPVFKVDNAYAVSSLARSSRAAQASSVVGRLFDPNSESYQNFVRAMRFQKDTIEGRGFERFSVGYNPRGQRVRVLVRRFDNNSPVGDTYVPKNPRGTNRYFYVTMDIRAGESAGAFGQRLMTSIRKLNEERRGKNNAGSDAFEDGDDEADNYEVYRVEREKYFGRMARGADYRSTAAERNYIRELSEDDLDVEIDEDDIPNPDELDEEDEFDDIDDKRASHTYQDVELEKWGIRPLIMRDFTCIYESLMVILWHYQNGRAPSVTNLDWRLYVHLHFNDEPLWAQQMFWDQRVWRCILYFNQKYQDQPVVGFFDAHKAKEELLKVKAFEEVEPLMVPKYYLVYYCEHVFPCLRQNLEFIVEHQESILGELAKKNYSELMFSIVPNILYYMSYEFKLSVFDEGRAPCGNYLFETLANVDLSVLLAFVKKKKGRQINKILNQVALQKEITTCRDFPREVYFEEVKANFYKPGNDQHNALVVAKLKTLAQKFEKFKGFLYYTPAERQHYDELCLYYENNKNQLATDQARMEFRERLAKKNRLFEFVLRREKRFDDEMGLAIIDIESYLDNDIENSSSLFNMVPFCLTLVGQLQQTSVVEITDQNGAQRLECRVRLVKGIKKIFMGMHPRECVSKFVKYLMDNNFCYTKNDFRKLKVTTGSIKQKQLFNNIFAHNGFGFDHLYLYEELHSKMREFHLVGDMTHTKTIQGNGLFFYDFALFYRQKLKVLAKKFFPDREDLQKKECNLVIGLPKDRVRQWYAECAEQDIKPRQHRYLGEIIEYCLRDSEVLYEIVRRFFRKTYTTPFGHGFLQKPFYHSLSSMSYTIFNSCYLRKPIFVNIKSLQIEQAAKRGGITAANSNRFGISVMVDKTSFYPAVMKNEMPVEYVKPLDEDPLVIINPPLRLTRANYRDHLIPYNLYQATYKHGKAVLLPCIATKTHGTLILVRESTKYDELRTHETANIQILFGIELMVAIEETDETEATIFGKIEFRPGDFIFREFINDMFEERQKAKRAGDEVGDMFYKDIMNSAQGKFGQNTFEKCVMGGIQFVTDFIKKIYQDPNLSDEPRVKQLLTNSVDLFEVKWSCKDEKNLAPGNTVRIPSYIMALARSDLMRTQNRIAQHFGNAHAIAYYDTDSINARLDLFEERLNALIQKTFDVCLDFVKEKNSLGQQAYLKRCILSKMIQSFANYIGQKMNACESMQQLYNLVVPDCTQIHTGAQFNMLDPVKLGACKIEKFVIRGFALGAKQYAMYYLEYNQRTDQYILKQAVKIKGVRDSARDMEMFKQIDQNLLTFQDISQNTDLDPSKLPVAISKLMDKWSRMGAGVIISQQQKYVRPTLTKRRHNIFDGTSEPFFDEQDFLQYKATYEKQMLEAKNVYKETCERIGQQVIDEAAKLKLQHATKVQNQIRNDSSNFFRKAVEMLAESRKRYLVRLQKIKFECVQDRVFELLLQDVDALQEAAIFLPKLEALAAQAIQMRRSTTRRGLADLQDDNNGGKMSTDIAAKVVAYIFYIYHFLTKRHKVTDVPENLTKVVNGLAKSLMHKLLLGEQTSSSFKKNERLDITSKERNNCHYWNYCLIYAFEFLQAGISCYGGTQEKFEFILRDNQNENLGELSIPLETKIVYTSLWRFFNNLQNRLALIREMGSKQEVVIEPPPMQEENKEIIDTSILRGQPAFHSFIVNDFHDRNNEQIRHRHEFDLINQLAKLDGQPVHLGKRIRREEEDENINEEYVGAFVGRKLLCDVRRRGVLTIQNEHIEHDELFDNDVRGELDRRISKVLLMHSLIEVKSPELIQKISEGDNYRNQVFTLLSELYTQGRSRDIFSPQLIHAAFAMNYSESTATRADKDDLLDVIFLYLYLRAGKRQAAMMMKVLHDDLQNKYHYTNSLAKQFVRVCQIVFCRNSMFKTFETQKRLSKNTEQILKSLMKLTVHYDPTKYESDEKFIIELNMLCDDPARLNQNMRQIIRMARDMPQLEQLGQEMYEQVKRWREPSQEMIMTLKSMLLLENNEIYVDAPTVVPHILKNKIFAIDRELGHRFEEEHKLEGQASYLNYFVPRKLVDKDNFENYMQQGDSQVAGEENQRDWQDLFEEAQADEDEWLQQLEQHRQYPANFFDRLIDDDAQDVFSLANSQDAREQDRLQRQREQVMRNYVDLEAEEGEEDEEEDELEEFIKEMHFTRNPKDFWEQ